MLKAVCCASLLGLLAASAAFAQPFDFPAAAGDAELAAAMTGLARQVIPAYRPIDREIDRDIDRDKSLDDRFRLQLVAGQPEEAGRTLAALRELRRAASSPPSPASTIQYEIYARAKALQAAESLPFDEAFKRSFREIVEGLDDATAAYELPWVLGTPLSYLEGTLREALEQRQGKTTLALPGAVDLIRKYFAAEAYRSFQPLVAALQEEDDRRRYIIDKNLRIRTPDGATVCALVVRPRALSKRSGRLPALLNFTIYSDPDRTMDEARLTAAHGYAGVEGFTRGKGCSPDQPVPIEHDGADAAALIDWISRQPWSDGRVGTFGGSYDGFTQWAAAKHRPKALKAMMPSVTFAPGIDFPMDGNVFMSYAYPWPFYTTNEKTLDDATYNDTARWERLHHDWYVSGKAYRSLDTIDGTPNPFFDRWLEHPSYDAYWQSAIPYRVEFARIDIPVLTTTGYYDSGQRGALYYFTQHYQYDPAADHYLVVGPYDHVRAQRGTISPTGNPMRVLRGYELDPVAQIEILKLRYQWFDYVFKGGPKPALLQDKVNYEVMGANLWRHAPSLAAMAGRRLRFHLSAERAGNAYWLRKEKPADAGVVPLTVDLADRSDVDRLTSPGGPIDQALDDWAIVEKAPRIGHSLEFIGDPLTEPTEISGLFSGHLDFITNKRDFDFSVTLFERTAEGEYFQLSYHWARASYAEDRSRRRLLAPGRREHLDFQSGRLTSRQLRPGSRLVIVLGILKQPGEQINYGTGKDVSDETLADAGEPLRIEWSTGSFIDVPVRR